MAKNVPAPAPAPVASKSEPDKKIIRAAFDKVFAFKLEIQREEEALAEKRKGSSDLLKSVLDATNGHTGPYTINGKTYTIISRKTKILDEDEKPVLDDKGKETFHISYHLRSPQDKAAISL